MEHFNIGKGKAVVLTWLDSAGSSGWQYGEKAQGESIELQSVGFVTKNTETDLTITCATDERTIGSWAPLSIPWVAILDIREIEPWKFTNSTKGKSELSTTTSPILTQLLTERTG